MSEVRAGWRGGVHTACGVPGPRRRAGGRGGRLAGPVCVCTRVPACLRARRRPLSIPLDKPGQAAPAQRASSAVLVCPAGSGRALRERGTDMQSRAPTSGRLWGPDPGGEAERFLCERLCQRPRPRLLWTVPPSRTARGQQSSLPVSAVPGRGPLPCPVRASSPLNPPPLPLEKHSGSLAKMNSGGALQLSPTHDTPRRRP